MRPAAFDYVAPATLSGCIDALATGGEDAKVLGGGQSLIPLLRMRMAAPTLLVDIGRVPELVGVHDDGDALVIGAMTTYDALCRDELVRRELPLVAQAAATVADPQVRHRGTLGGALAHADPAGDLGAVALALDAELTLSGPGGTRHVAAGAFFSDFLTTTLGLGEILTSVRIPKFARGERSHYEKFTRVAQAWSIVAVAAVVRVEGGAVADARVGLTNMGSTPLRAPGVERALLGIGVAEALAEGHPATDGALVEAVGAAAAHAAEGTRAPSDLNGGSDYREHLARVLTKRAVLAALAPGGA